MCGVRMSALFQRRARHADSRIGSYGGLLRTDVRCRPSTPATVFALVDFSILLAKTRQRPAIIGGIIGAAVFVLLFLLRAGGYMQAIELAARDAYLRWTPTARANDERVVLVTITDQDISTLGHWPMTDATLANIISALNDHAPRAVGFDLYRDLAVPPGSEALNARLQENARLVMAEKFGAAGEPAVAPPAALAGTEQVGFADLMVDPGGAVRRALLFLDDGTRVAYSLPLRLALRYLADEDIHPAADDTNPAHLKLGPATLVPLASHDGAYVGADDRGYQMLLDFEGGLRPFASYTLGDLLAARIPREAIRDRIVLVGVTADSVKDLFLTPFSHDQGAVASVPGVYLHAQATRQLLRNALDGASPPRFLSEPAEYAWILVWTALGAASALRLQTIFRLVLFALSAWTVLLCGTYGAHLAGWWLPVVPAGCGLFIAAVAGVAYVSVLERSERRFLMEIFSKHVSGDVAEEIWRQRNALLSDGRIATQELTVTVLFSDLENFTPIAEALSARAMMDWLNQYMEAMAGLVIQYGGVVDDYYGDAIKANFGAPIARTAAADIADDARRAVACAMAMAEAMDDINRRYAAQGLPPVRMRIGLATGQVVAGCLGSAQRMKYTTIGDVVNTAARLQAFGKEIAASPGPCTTIVAGETARLLDASFDCEYVGTPALKGKAQAVQAYLVRAQTRDVSDVASLPNTSTLVEGHR